MFEEIVEGQATRFAAVFNSMEANPVGPIRSGRTQDVNLLLSLNDPAIVYSGANEAVNDALQGAGFELFGEGTPGFFRRDDRPAPHNLYANLAAAVAAAGQLGQRRPCLRLRRTRPGGRRHTGDVRRDDGRQLQRAVGLGCGPRSVPALPARFPTRADRRAGQRRQRRRARPRLRHEPRRRRPRGPHARYRNSSRVQRRTQDRRHVDAATTRPTRSRLEANGQPILLAPGRTWVELVDEQHNLTDG